MDQARWLGAFRVPGGEPGVLALPRWFGRPLVRLGPRALVAFAGAVAILFTGYVTFKRARFPYDLEWMEGGALVHVARILEGSPLYVPPSLEFTPYIYTPLYWYVSAGFAKVMGLSLFTLRLVSL